MSRSRLYLHVLFGVMVMSLILIGEQFAHEAVHVAINFAATGEIGSCGQFGPLSVGELGRLSVCFPEEGIGAYNFLLTPLIMSLFGLVLIYLSPRFERRYLSWATLAAGGYIWLFEALYSMGWLNPPTITEGEVSYMGDGIVAIETFGRAAMIPGMLIIAWGVFVLMSRIEYGAGPINEL